MLSLPSSVADLLSQQETLAQQSKVVLAVQEGDSAAYRITSVVTLFITYVKPEEALVRAFSDSDDPGLQWLRILDKSSLFPTGSFATRLRHLKLFMFG